MLSPKFCEMLVYSSQHLGWFCIPKVLFSLLQTALGKPQHSANKALREQKPSLHNLQESFGAGLTPRPHVPSFVLSASQDCTRITQFNVKINRSCSAWTGSAPNSNTLWIIHSFDSPCESWLSQSITSPAVRWAGAAAPCINHHGGKNKTKQTTTFSLLHPSTCIQLICLNLCSSLKGQVHYGNTDNCTEQMIREGRSVSSCLQVQILE